MLHVLCLTIIILNSYHLIINSNYMCKAVGHGQVNFYQVIQKIKDYIDNGANYVSNNLFKEKTKQTFREEFIKNVQRGLKVIKLSAETGELPNKKKLVNFAPPKRKYKHLKIGKSAIQRIKAHGYKAETYKIHTSDGYTLTVQRIVSSTKVPSTEAVILHHGILGSSEDWLLLGPGRALPYLLSDHGYDVWLLNARGNKYSRAHDDIDLESSDFWDFSWHEMGTHDLTAAITYIKGYTNNANLYYIGHSMGGTALLVLLSTYPEYNQKLKMAILLAPLAFMSTAKGPLKYFGYDSNQTNIYLGYNRTEFLANYTFPEAIIDKYCQGSDRTCSNPLLLLSNGGKEISDPELRHEILTHVPAGGSMKTMIHYMQLIKSGHFQMFDYGKLNNLKKYRTKCPPKYNLSAIHLPIALYSSASDWLSTESDITTLLDNLKSVRAYDELDNFDHFDFVWAKDAAYLLYYILIDSLNDNPSRKRTNTFVTAML